MQDNKFTFSQKELQFITDKDYYLQKIAIIKKLNSLFHELNDQIEIIKSENEKIIPLEARQSTGKISKGENYLGLPYLVLDNPRVFTDKNIFAFRAMFWWGNYFSFTLHLSGKYIKSYKINILNNLKNLQQKNFLICIHSEQWVHHLDKDNYLPLDNFTQQEVENLIESNKFIKLSRKLQLTNYGQFIDFGNTTFKDYLSLLKL